jgi:O-antigen biosynthesis protein
MRVWRAGFKVLFEPESQIVHLEGSVHGTNPSQGGKRHQVKNRDKFLERWSDVLIGYPSAPADYNLAVWHDLAVRQPRLVENA